MNPRHRTMKRLRGEGTAAFRSRWLAPIGAIAALAVVAAPNGSAVEHTGSTPSSAEKRCPPGFVHGVIAGQHKCLKAGQRCRKRLDRAYHRYKVHCHSGRLTRHRRPKPKPAPSRGVLERFQLSSDVYRFAVGADSLWVEEEGLVRIDRTTRVVTSRVRDTGSPAFHGAELWAATRGRVLKLDPRTGTVLASAPVEGEYGIVHPADGVVWVSSGTEGSPEVRFTRIDAGTTQVVGTVGATCREGEGADFKLGYGSLWQACKDDGAVLRVDADTGRTLATISTGAGAHTIAIGFGSVWVTNYRANTVSRIDPATNRVVATISGVGRSPGITAALGAVWSGGPSLVAKIDPATNAVVGRLAIAGAGAQEIYHVVEAEGSLWASVVNLRRVYRLNPTAVG